MAVNLLRKNERRKNNGRFKVTYKLKKRIDATLQQIGDAMITGGVDNMEKYKYLLGQAQAYQIIKQEISNLLKEDKEQNDGNVIDIKGKGSSKT